MGERPDWHPRVQVSSGVALQESSVKLLGWMDAGECPDKCGHRHLSGVYVSGVMSDVEWGGWPADTPVELCMHDFIPLTDFDG